MREIFTYGSVGGALGNQCFYPEIQERDLLFPFREPHLRRRITRRDSWGVRSRDTIASLHPEICSEHISAKNSGVS